MRLLALAATSYFLAVAWLHPSSVSYDGLSSLRSLREGWVDPGHALHVPLLGAFERLAGRWLDPLGCARLFSALGATLVFVLSWRRLVRGGLADGPAGLVTSLFAASTLFWQEAGSVEPTTWTVASLLVARSAAERHARTGATGALLALLVAGAAALGFHLVSVCALPWLVRGAWPRDGRWSRATLALLAAVSIGLVLLLLRLRLHWAGFAGYWGGHAVELDEHAARAGAHLLRGGELLLLGAPMLLLTSLAVALRSPREMRAHAAWLALPYAFVFLVLGKPLVGLLVPCLLALTLGLAAGLARSSTPAAMRALAVAAGLQLAYAGVHATLTRRAEDTPRRQAAALARHLPPDVVLFAGSLANHLRYYHPELAVVSLPEELYRARAERPGADPAEVFLAVVQSTPGARALSSDGAAFLIAKGAAPDRLGLRLGAARLVPEDPKLALFPLEP